MANKRFFVDKIADEITIEGDEFLHAKNVLRVSVGEEIVLLDGTGKEYCAVINRIDKRALLCRVFSVREGEKECKTDVTLLCGTLKGDKTEFVIQKATELGVREIGIFGSRFCSAYVNANKLERFNKVAREAAKQCLRAVAPAVRYFENLHDALTFGAPSQNKIFACEFAERSEIDIRTLQGSCTLVVGSEGGFAAEEFSLAQSLGYNGVTLGKRILRAETAAVALTSVVMCSLGEWQ